MNAADDLCPTCYGLLGAVNGEVGYGCICGVVSNEGGLGGNIRPVGIRDTRLIERALRYQWNIPQSRRRAIIERQIHIATSEFASPREATAACKAILAANEQNLKAAAMAMPKEPAQSLTMNVVGGDGAKINIQVVEDDHWYGNDAHDRITQAPAAPATDPPQPG